MAVLVEAISVIVKKDAIDKKYPDGLVAYIKAAPNSTYCADDSLTRIGFMSPQDSGAFVDKLERFGLIHQKDNKAIDVVVVDQQQGCTSDCDWIQFSKVKYEDKGMVSICWYYGGDKDKGAGLYIDGASMDLATPGYWKYEGSLSHTYAFVPNESMDKAMAFLRHENGLDVYHNPLTGEECFIGKPSK